MRRSLLALLPFLVAGCGLFVEDGADLGAFADFEAYQEERAALYAELDRAIGEAEAGSVEACRVVPVGAKGCGGPWGYRVYSSEASPVRAVESLARAITEADRQANVQFDLVSDCMAVEPPRPALVGGRCVAAE